MSPPVAETHPTEIVLTVVTLHVVTASILLDTDVTLGTVLCVCRDVVCSFTVVSTLSQPPLDGITISGGVVRVAALEAEPGFTGGTDSVLGDTVHCLDDYGAIRARAEAEIGVTSDIVKET